MTVSRAGHNVDEMHRAFVVSMFGVTDRLFIMKEFSGGTYAVCAMFFVSVCRMAAIL